MASTTSAPTTEMATDDAPEGYIKGKEGFGYLPPLHRIVLPKTGTQTALVRWLFTMGYPVKEISNGLGVRYQQVRNMVTTQPKRAAREDLPELKIELAEMEDAVDLLLGMELERTHLDARSASKKSAHRERKTGKPKGKVVEELPTVLTEDDTGNEDLDDENYGRS